MADHTDFLAFYRQLGLHPNCSVEELKNAYRRRVAELHPDRRAGNADPADAAKLQELTAAYGAATIFQRRYGRLPGAAHHHTAAQAPMPRPSVASRMPMAETPAPRRGSRRYLLLWLLLLAGVGWWIWNGSGDDTDGRSDAPRANAVPMTASTATAGVAETHIEIGMESDVVLALEGRPLMQNEDRWDYGPSWIGFNRGKVSDWYSSKLRPLKVASTRPPPLPAGKAH